MLQYIQYLFFCLLQLILHQDHTFLDGGIIGFGAGGVDLTAKFLQDERKFFSFTGLFLGQYRPEIITMVP